MVEPVAKAWVCEACGRRVPPQVPQCRCGVSRPVAVDDSVDQESDALADESSGNEPGGRASAARPLVLAVVGLALLALFAVWRSRTPTRDESRNGLKPGATTSALPSQPTAASSSPDSRIRLKPDSASGARSTSEAGTGAPFKVELPPDLEAQLAPRSAAQPAPAPHGAAVVDAGSVEDVVQRVIASVALIEAGGMRGTGFFAATGVVVTNAHVVGSEGYVTLKLSDGQSLSGRVVRTVPAMDLAAVQVDRPTPAQRPLPFRPASEVRVGQEVLAVGSALGVLQNTVTRGIVSAIRSTGGITLIQTDAAVNPGNSGGPLVDRQGQVVGVTTLKVGGQAQSLGFAVAADHARALLEGRVDSLAQVSGTLQDRVNHSLTGDTSSASDREREQALATLEAEVRQVAQFADRVDSAWTQYRAACLPGVPLKRGFDREWFAVLDRGIPNLPVLGCGPLTDDITRAVARVRESMSDAVGRAKRAGALPGDLRDVCRRYRLEWQW